MSKKIPGIYMIRNKFNNKVYIGESVDIRSRWCRYCWDTYNDTEDRKSARAIVSAMREHGIENFEFTVLASGDAYENKRLRYATEARYIAEYNSTNPECGYNRIEGIKNITCYDNPYKPRIQSTREKLKRAKAIYEYDTKTDSIMLYLGGAKAWGKANGFKKDVASHTVKRGSLILGRYYLIYASKDLRREQLEKIRDKKCNCDGRLQRSVTRSTKIFDEYEKAVQAVERILKSRKYE